MLHEVWLINILLLVISLKTLCIHIMDLHCEMKVDYTTAPVLLVCKNKLMCEAVTVTAVGCYAAFLTIGSRKTYTCASVTPREIINEVNKRRKVGIFFITYYNKMWRQILLI